MQHRFVTLGVSHVISSSYRLKFLCPWRFVCSLFLVPLVLSLSFFLPFYDFDAIHVVQAIILVYDITNTQSFQNLEEWLKVVSDVFKKVH